MDLVNVSDFWVSAKGKPLVINQEAETNAKNLKSNLL